MNFPQPADEQAFLRDISTHYEAQAVVLGKKDHFKKSDISKYQAVSALADAALDLANLLREESQKTTN